MYRSLNVVASLCVVYFVAVLGKQEIYTKDEVKYIFFPYSNASIIHFKVKTANDAHVGLTTGPEESDPMIEIVIGGWANTNSVIRRRFRTIPEKVTMETPGILSAGEFRGFWVRWDGGVISVGREDTSIPFMSWADPSPFRVSYAGVHTGFGASGSWIIEDPPSTPSAASPASSESVDIAPNVHCSEPQAKAKLSCQDIFTTANDDKYKFYAYTSRYISFKVKATNDVHVGVSTGPTLGGPMVEVVIGGWRNTKSFIRRIYKSEPDKFTVYDKVVAETLGILDAGEFRGFWISLDGGTVKVGREGADVPLMSWPDPDPFPIKFIGVHTGHGSTGAWRFEDPSANPVALPPSSVCCNCCYRKPLINSKDIFTEDTVVYKFFPFSNTSTSVNFRVRAANDVHLGLGTKPTLSGPMYEVLLGGWTSSRNILRRIYHVEPDKFSVSDKVTLETPGVVSANELRGFWVRWYGGVVMVGREGTDDPFMSWQDPDPFLVTHIGVHTGYGSTGSWHIEDPALALATAGLPSSAPDAEVNSQCCRCCKRGPLLSGYTTAPPAFTNACHN